MFKSVIVGFDGGEGGRDATALADLLVSDGGRLTRAFIDNGDPRAWRGAIPPEEIADLAHGQSPSIGDGLHELAERIDADLLVVGSSRRGLLGRVLLGDDTQEALSGAPCAVAIAPLGFGGRERTIARIGVGYNGSPESEHALRVSRALARSLDARLAAFEAVAIPALVTLGAQAPVSIPSDEMIHDALERLAKLPDVEPHATYGPAPAELERFSESVDLLVVGSRSHGPLGRVVHGSVTRGLARSSRCPLLVLTRGARERDAEAARAGGHEREGSTAEAVVERG